MNKVFGKLVLSLIITVTLFSSCSKKTISIAEEPTQAQEVIFLQALAHYKKMKAPKSVEKFYYPAALDRFFFRHSLENGENLYLIEKYYSNAKGRIDVAGIYSPECDDGKWIAQLVDTVEEERFGSELIDILENELYIQPPVELNELPLEFGEESVDSLEEKTLPEKTAVNKETSEKSKDEVTTEIIEKRLLGANNRLKMMEFGKEIFVPVVKKDSFITVHTNETQVVRRFYDEAFRLIKKETWFINELSDSKLLNSEEYAFDYDGSTVKNVTAGDKSIRTKYDKLNHLLYAETYEKIDGKEILKVKNNWTYDEKGRITTEENLEYEYENGKIIKTNSKKEIYRYKLINGTELNQPDYEYYEDGILKIKTEYSAEKFYTTSIFFDETFSVISYYENNKKVREVYTAGGFIKRVKNYE